jgi:hypothetical protein
MLGQGKFAAVFSVIGIVAGTYFHGLVHERMRPARRGIGIRRQHRLTDPARAAGLKKLAGGSDSRRKNYKLHGG